MTIYEVLTKFIVDLSGLKSGVASAGVEVKRAADQLSKSAQIMPEINMSKVTTALSGLKSTLQGAMQGLSGFGMGDLARLSTAKGFFESIYANMERMSKLYDKARIYGYSSAGQRPSAESIYNKPEWAGMQPGGFSPFNLQQLSRIMKIQGVAFEPFLNSFVAVERGFNKKLRYYQRYQMQLQQLLNGNGYTGVDAANMANQLSSMMTSNDKGLQMEGYNRMLDLFNTYRGDNAGREQLAKSLLGSNAPLKLIEDGKNALREKMSDGFYQVFGSPKEAGFNEKARKSDEMIDKIDEAMMNLQDMLTNMLTGENFSRIEKLIDLISKIIQVLVDNSDKVLGVVAAYLGLKALAPFAGAAAGGAASGAAGGAAAAGGIWAIPRMIKNGIMSVQGGISAANAQKEVVKAAFVKKTLGEQLVEESLNRVREYEKLGIKPSGVRDVPIRNIPYPVTSQTVLGGSESLKQAKLKEDLSFVLKKQNPFDPELSTLGKMESEVRDRADNLVIKLTEDYAKSEKNFSEAYEKLQSILKSKPLRILRGASRVLSTIANMLVVDELTSVWSEGKGLIRAIVPDNDKWYTNLPRMFGAYNSKTNERDLSTKLVKSGGIMAKYGGGLTAWGLGALTGAGTAGIATVGGAGAAVGMGSWYVTKGAMALGKKITGTDYSTDHPVFQPLFKWMLGGNRPDAGTMSDDSGLLGERTLQVLQKLDSSVNNLNNTLSQNQRNSLRFLGQMGNP